MKKNIAKPVKHKAHAAMLEAGVPHDGVNGRTRPVTEEFIPLIDLKAQYFSIKEDMDSAVASVFESGLFVLGENGRRFENDFATYLGARFCVGVGNGTDAIYLALKSLGIGPGDEVITVSHTFAATVEAIARTGARPVFVDIREETMLMDYDALEDAITSASKAIIPVHLYGHPCSMDRIMRVAETRGLFVVEDAAQAHGAQWMGKYVGTIGNAGCFSFFPGKILGASGDAGAIVTADEKLSSEARLLANHGRSDKHTHTERGINSRLDEIQAAILDVKLRHLGKWIEGRRRVAGIYTGVMSSSGVTLPSVLDGAAHSWHQFVIRVGNRNILQERLREKGIATGIHYPIPVHLQPAYREFGKGSGSLPVTERVVSQVLSLPIYPELSDDMAIRVGEAVLTHAIPPG